VDNCHLFAFEVRSVTDMSYIYRNSCVFVIKARTYYLPYLVIGVGNIWKYFSHLQWVVKL